MKKMGTVIVFNREELPVLNGFKGRTLAPQVSVGDTGRIMLSKLASEPFVGCKWVEFSWEESDRKLTIKGLSGIPKGKKESQYWPCQIGKENRSVTIASAQILTAIEYHYKEAGHQTFQAHVDEKSKSVSFTVPAETPERRPTKPRAKRKTTTAASTPVSHEATGAAGVASPA